MCFVNSLRRLTVCYTFLGLLFVTTHAVGADPEQNVYFRKGSDALLQCGDYSANWKAQFKWIFWSAYNKTDGKYYGLIMEYRNGTVFRNPKIRMAFFKRVEMKGRASLLIKGISFVHSTKYKCTLVGNRIVDKSSFVQLVVTGEASVQAPVQLAEIGTSVTFNCKATGVPSQNFKWKRSRQAEEITNDAKYKITSSGAGSSQLTIMSISVADRGYYVCDARVSVHQYSSASCYLQVQWPTLKQDDTTCPMRSYTVGVGKQLSLCCPVSGYPPPVVTWEKNGAQLRKGENKMLTITPKKDEDFGNYACTATDGRSSIGPFNISVTNVIGVIVIKEP